MKPKYLLLLLMLLGCLPLLCGCIADVSNPLAKEEATPIPGLTQKLHPASASQTNVDVIQASLYYRYLDEPMLAAETRILTIPRDESTELGIVKALLEGPSAGHSDLRRLFPKSVIVESVTSRDNILFITLNEALLTDDKIPADWQSRSEWVTEAPLFRKLAIQSLVATLTESFPYTGVQILVHQTSQVQNSLRLDNSYFLDGSQGLSEPQSRDESLLLTPQNTILRLLTAWQAGDIATLYAYLANADDGQPKPSYQDFALQLDMLPTLAGVAIGGGGSISADGQRAVITAELTILRNGDLFTYVGYPLFLVRENDIWKINYSQLEKLLFL